VTTSLPGTVLAPGFEPLEEVFHRGLSRQGSGGAAFSATVDGVEVVSLYGGQSGPGRAWQRETPAVLMSTTKGFAGLCAAMLSDRGLLDPDAPVVDYWPEFGAKGKERTLVRHVLLHTCGVIGLPRSAQLLGWDGRGWDDLDAIAAGLADAEPAWEPGTRQGYHAVTYGWLVGELVRRVTGRTLGQFFREEVAEPLGIATAVGVAREVFDTVAVVDTQALMHHPWPKRLVVEAAARRMRDPATMAGRAFLGDGERSIMDVVAGLLALPAFLAAEIPSSNGVSSASDLARVFAVLANDGALGDVQLLSPETVRRFAEPVARYDDAVVGASLPFPLAQLARRASRVTRSLGYVVNEPGAGPRRLGPNPRAYGSEGAGGQVGFCDHDARVSVGFVRNGLSESPQHVLDLVAALYRCLEARGSL
jgi:CubicO group peptidase (beta-lactamase class C family)